MSRTYAHRPLRLLKNEEGYIDPWKWEYRKLENVKGRLWARDDRRRIRHSPIDEDGKYLANAIKEYKFDMFAWNKYW